MLRERKPRKSLPTTLKPNVNSDRKSAREKWKPGRHGLTAQSNSTDTAALVSCWPTSDHAP
jgi:hypothetical protein